MYFKCCLFFLGDWMNSSAGLAFAPHVIRVAVGEVWRIPTALWSVYCLELVYVGATELKT